MKAAARLAWIVLIFLTGMQLEATPQSASAASENQNADLKFVVYLLRHGVRSPTGKAAQYNPYSLSLWPVWNTPPGYLTAHGFRLMQIFGAYDRVQLAGEGLIRANGCDDADHVTIYADSDERTRDTGKALAEGLFPGCSPAVLGLPEKAPDPLFHPLEAGAVRADPELAVAAISGRIGGDPNNLTTVFRERLAELDSVLAKCGTPAAGAGNRVSIFDVPAKLSTGSAEHPAELRGPLNTASTLTENLLLEYAEGMDASEVGWGCVTGENLRSLLALHAAASDVSQRTAVIARLQASNLLNQIRQAIEQAAVGKPIPGSISRPDDRALFLVGHDTNLSNIAGLLNLTWIADGRSGDTPPGGALVFELWRSRMTKEESVRVYYTTQTLEQMRSTTVLTQSNPPLRIPLFIPDCSTKNFSCSLQSFSATVNQAVEPQVVSSKN